MTQHIRKRQARGHRRMASILDAASALFAEVGYNAATMNELAARAEISPGSLYQFFPNKRAVADALAERYLLDWQDMQRATEDPGLDDLLLRERVAGVVAPMVAFHLKNPAAKVLLTGAEVSPDLAAAMQALRDATLERVGGLIIPHPRALTTAERRRVGRVCVQIFNGVLTLIHEAPEADRPGLVAELERALVAYLTAVEADARTRPAAPRSSRAR